MDRHRSGYDNEDYDILSQETPYPLTAPSLSTPRGGLQNLDLNSQAEDFPYMDSYTDTVQFEEGHGEPRLPPLPPRSGHGPFQPPRQGGGGRGPSRGACQAAARQGQHKSRNSLNTRAAAGSVPQGSTPPAQFNPPVVGGGGRATLMPNHPGRASSSSSAGNGYDNLSRLQTRASSAPGGGYYTNILTQEEDDDLVLLRQQEVQQDAIPSTGGKSKRGRNYTNLEDIQLCKSWIHISNDPIIGNQQSGRTYWEGIAKDFHSNRDFESDRTPNSLEHRFGIILKDCMLFQGFYDEVERRHPSCIPYHEHVLEAQARYARKSNGKNCQFEYCWQTLRQTQKFQSTLEANKKPTKFRKSNLSVGSQQQEDVSTAQGQESSSIPSAKTTRPPGRRQSKEKLKRNEGDDEFKDIMQNLLVMKTEENMMKKQKWDNDKKLEERRLKIDEDQLRWDQEKTVMFCDVATMDEDQRAYVKAKRAKMAKEMSASVSETASGESVNLC